VRRRHREHLLLRPSRQGAAGLKVAIAWPNQASSGVHVNVSGAGVTRHAKNPDEARRLLEWLSSAGAQGLIRQPQPGISRQPCDRARPGSGRLGQLQGRPGQRRRRRPPAGGRRDADGPRRLSLRCPGSRTPRAKPRRDPTLLASAAPWRAVAARRAPPGHGDGGAARRPVLRLGHAGNRGLAAPAATVLPGLLRNTAALLLGVGAAPWRWAAASPG